MLKVKDHVVHSETETVKSGIRWGYRDLPFSKWTMELFTGTSQSAGLWPTCQIYKGCLSYFGLSLVRISISLSHFVLVYPQWCRLKSVEIASMGCMYSIVSLKVSIPCTESSATQIGIKDRGCIYFVQSTRDRVDPWESRGTFQRICWWLRTNRGRASPRSSP